MISSPGQFLPIYNRFALRTADNNRYSLPNFFQRAETTS